MLPQMTQCYSSYATPSRMVGLRARRRPFDSRDELTVEGDLVFKGQQTVIPATLEGTHGCYTFLLHRH